MKLYEQTVLLTLRRCRSPDTGKLKLFKLFRLAFSKSGANILAEKISGFGRGPATGDRGPGAELQPSLDSTLLG
jgi:hypothetical protein